MLDGDDPHRHDATGMPMSETLYPMGYGTKLVTMAELRAKHELDLHPAAAPRIFGWLESCGGLVGIGGGVRADGSQPDKPGFAPEGQSFHQRQPFRDLNGGRAFAAFDLVVRNEVPGKPHRSPRWQEVPHRGNAVAKAWGVHCNVYPSEPWHLQPIEISGWRSWVLRGRPGLAAAYPIPGRPRVIAPAPTQRRRLVGQVGNVKSEVVALQNLCNFWGWRDDHNRPLLADGQFGALTELAVKAMQRALGVAADGIYGRRTATAAQAFLDAMTGGKP